MRHDDNELVPTIQRIERELDEMKQTPQFFGIDSLLSYKTASTNPYDFTTTLSIGQIKNYRLTFTFDQSNQGAILQLQIYYSLDNPNVMSDPVARRPSTNPHVDVKWAKETFESTYQTWIVTVRNISITLTPVPYLKFFFDGTDTGTYSFIQI